MEAGHLADLLILDRNPLDPEIPANQLSQIKVHVTMIDGKAAYVSPDMVF